MGWDVALGLIGYSIHGNAKRESLGVGSRHSGVEESLTKGIEKLLAEQWQGWGVRGTPQMAGAA